MVNHYVLRNCQFIILVLAILLISVTTSAEYSVSSFNLSHVQYCGKINISFPFAFGIAENTSFNNHFSITCDETTTPPRAFFKNSTLEVSDIYLDGRVRILNFVVHSCYRRGVKVSSEDTWFSSSPPFFVNNEANKFTIMGCDAYGYATGKRLYRNFSDGCDATCGERADLLEGSCRGLGCCHVSIPRDICFVNLELSSFENYTNVENFTNCSPWVYC